MNNIVLYPTSSYRLLSINNELLYTINDQFHRNSYSHKIGRMAGKCVEFFRREETKAITLISYWSAETLISALMLTTVTNPYITIAAIAMWVYGSYALISLISNKVNTE